MLGVAVPIAQSSWYTSSPFDKMSSTSIEFPLHAEPSAALYIQKETEQKMHSNEYENKINQRF